MGATTCRVRLRSVLAALLVIGAAAPASAAWTPVEGTANSYDYLDPASLRVDGTLRRVWTLHDLTERDAEGDMSYRSLLEFHCPEARYRSLQNLFYAGAMGTGRMSGRSSAPGAWRAVQPESVAASIMRRVCAKP